MTQTELDERLRAAIGSKVPGVVVIVVGAEGVRARSAVGFADVVARLPMATDVQLPWFSMTKILTATAAMCLAERGILDLDQPILPFVSAVRSLRPLAWAERITPRHLLQHSSGLSNPIPITWIHPADELGPDPDVFLERLLRKHPRLRFEPGSRAEYSNLGTLTLGAAIARAGGAAFEAITQNHVLAPVGMCSTGYRYFQDRPAAVGYHPRRSPIRLLLPRWVKGPSAGHWMAFRPFLVDGAPYGGLVGSAEDAARFLQMHLCDGEIHGTRVISAKAAEEMRRINLRGRRLDLGLGWLLPASQRNADPAFAEHRGGGAGFLNVMRMYPSLRVGAVVMGNSTNYNIDAVARIACEFQATSRQS